MPERGACDEPRRGRGHDDPCQGVDDRLVVDPPTLEVEPGVVRRALGREIDRLEPAEAFVELLARQTDGRRGERVVVVGDAQRPGHGTQAVDPHREAEAGLPWRLRGAHGVVERRRVHHRHQADQPTAGRDGRAEPDQPGVVGVALRHGGRPALPVRVQRRELVHGVQPVGAGQDLGTPGRIARPRLEQRHLGLAGGELVVERGQVGDFERDHQKADARGDDLDDSRPGLARRDDAEREDGRARDAERRGEVGPRRRTTRSGRHPER